jgi:curved DNA-binding protein CbpA
MSEATRDYYKILGVKQDASEEKIRERWLELVKHHHPDLESGDVVDEKIKEINEAYQVLKQPLARWEYDLQRTCEREIGKSSMRRWAPLCGVLILILVAGGLYLIGTDILSELNSGPTAKVPQMSQEEMSQPLPSKVAKEEGVANADDKVEKVAKPLTPPVTVEKTVKVQEATVNAGLKNSARGLSKTDDISPKPVPAQSTEKVRIEQPGRVKEQVSLKSNLHKNVSSGSVTETKPQPAETKLADHSKPPFVASEEEVKAFFGNYTMIYNQKNI